MSGLWDPTRKKGLQRVVVTPLTQQSSSESKRAKTLTGQSRSMDVLPFLVRTIRAVVRAVEAGVRGLLRSARCLMNRMRF